MTVGLYQSVAVLPSATAFTICSVTIKLKSFALAPVTSDVITETAPGLLSSQCWCIYTSLAVALPSNFIISGNTSVIVTVSPAVMDAISERSTLTS